MKGSNPTLKDRAHQLSITLCLQAPVLTQSAGARSQGLDSAMWCYKGQPALPGSLVKGNIRHALVRINALSGNAIAGDIAKWFGMPSGGASTSKQANDDTKDFAPNVGSAIFDYAWMYQTKKDNKGEGDSLNAQQKNTKIKFIEKQDVRTRITINANTGAVEHGHIQTIESPFAVGEYVTFTGKVFIRCNADELVRLQRYLEMALYYIPAIGALKGAGFGRVCAKDCRVNNESGDSSTHVSLSKPSLPFDATKRYQLQLRLDRPFCISARPLAETNRFESLDYIPGHVLKGAMAAAFIHRHNAHVGFDLLHVSHAFATQTANNAVYPVAAGIIPKSIVIADNQVFDLALLSAGAPRACFLIRECAPKFETDWKAEERNTVKEKLSLTVPELDKALSLHTRITPDKNYAEKNGLFSQEEVLPFNDKDDLTWCATLHIPAESHEKLNEKTLGELTELYRYLETEGILNIGRTHAKAQVAITQLENDSTAPTAKGSQECALHTAYSGADDTFLYVLTLQSDALLLPQFLSHEKTLIQSTNGDASLHQLYEDYWQAQSQNLQLVSYFATQRQMGGRYYHAYYRRRSNSVDAYQTDWLTEAGSVFVFTVNTSDREHVETMMKAWLDGGLPLHPDYGDCTWKDIPYIPQNGYGAVLINQACHQNLAPSTNEVTVFQEA